MRFHVLTRCVPLDQAARRLGLDPAQFAGHLPALLSNGFPRPDPVTGNFDLLAIEYWQNTRSGNRAANERMDSSNVEREVALARALGKRPPKQAL